jgi:hypothetical protein
MMCRQLLRLFFLVLLLIGGRSVLAQECIRLQGLVKDASNGDALVGATVIIEELRCALTTNLKGEYSLTGFQQGEYTLTASLPCFQSFRKIISVKEGYSLKINFMLQPTLPEQSKFPHPHDLAQQVQQTESGRP